MESYNDRLKENGGKVDEIAKSIEGEIENRKKELESMTERLDRIETSAQRLVDGGNKVKSFHDELYDTIKENPLVDAYRQKKASSAPMELKAAITMTQAASLTGDVIAADRRSGVIFDPDRTQHVRNLLPITSTTSNRISYTREDWDEDNTAMVAEGGTKPLSSFKLVQLEAPAKKIATRLKLGRETLDDISYLASHIANRAPRKLLLLEDNQLLYGDGTGDNLEGIAEVATGFDATGLGIAAGAANRNRFDILAWAMQQVNQDEYAASAALVNTADYWNMVLTKDDESRYLTPNIFTGGEIRIAGIPVFWSTAVTSGQFFVGDWGMGAEIADRMGTEVRFYDQNEDDAIKNLFTVIVEKRLAFPIFRPKAFVHDTFAAAIAAT